MEGKNTETKIVRIRRKGGEIVQDADIYIGRQITMGGWNLPCSKWRNPYKSGKDGTIEEVLQKYEDHIRSSGLINDIEELRGKTLGCWCKPDPCHGDILLKLLNEKNGTVKVKKLKIVIRPKT